MSASEFEVFASITQDLDLEPLTLTYTDAPMQAIFRRDAIVTHDNTALIAKAFHETYDTSHVLMGRRWEHYGVMYAAHLILTGIVDKVYMITKPARDDDELANPVSRTYNVTPYVDAAWRLSTTGQLLDGIYDTFNTEVLARSAGLKVQGDLSELSMLEVIIAGHATERFITDYRDYII